MAGLVPRVPNNLVALALAANRVSARVPRCLEASKLCACTYLTCPVASCTCWYPPGRATSSTFRADNQVQGWQHCCFWLGCLAEGRVKEEDGMGCESLSMHGGVD